VILELLDGRHDGRACRRPQQVTQIPDNFGTLRVRESAATERIRDLFVQIGTIRHNNDGRVAQFLEVPQFDGQVEHRQSISGPLRRPDDTALVPSVSCQLKCVPLPYWRRGTAGSGRIS